MTLNYINTRGEGLQRGGLMTRAAMLTRGPAADEEKQQAPAPSRHHVLQVPAPLRDRGVRNVDSEAPDALEHGAGSAAGLRGHVQLRAAALCVMPATFVFLTVFHRCLMK